MKNMDPNICPVCRSELQRQIVLNPNFSQVIFCPCCGQFAMTAEFYEDHVELSISKNDRHRLAIFLKRHLSDKLRPYLSNDPIEVPKGYQNYPYCMSILTVDEVQQ